MSDFDPVRAQGEVIAGLHEVHKLLQTRRRESERALAEAETDHEALAKLEAFVGELVAQAEARRKELQDEAERAAKGGGQ